MRSFLRFSFISVSTFNETQTLNTILVVSIHHSRGSFLNLYVLLTVVVRLRCWTIIYFRLYSSQLCGYWLCLEIICKDILLCPRPELHATVTNSSPTLTISANRKKYMFPIQWTNGLNLYDLHVISVNINRLWNSIITVQV